MPLIAILFRVASRPVVLIASLTALTLGGAAAADLSKLSITAEGAAAVRAIFSLHPDAKVRNDDRMAMALVHPAYWHYSSLSDDFEGAYRVIKSFGWTSPFYINARTKHIDHVLKQVTADGVAQVVNLGAGYDSRAYRFRRLMPAVKFFEIERPEMVAEKKRRLRAVLGELPEQVTFVPVDFNRQTVAEALDKAGYDPGVKTLYIWEGVTMYISSEAVDSTLRFIANQSPQGSSVVFDYMPLAVVEGDFRGYNDMRGLASWARYRGEPLLFGIRVGRGVDYVEERGFKVLSDIGPKMLESRYLTRSDGSLDGRCATGFRIMHAAVR